MCTLKIMFNVNFLKKVLETLPTESLTVRKILTSNKIDCFLLCHNVGLYHIESSPLICRATQWTDFYMIKTSVIKS